LNVGSALLVNWAPLRLSLIAVSSHSLAGRSASRSLAPLGSVKLGIAKLAAADDGSSALDSAADGAADSDALVAEA